MFDTLYAEGQRRYVETFSAYARQFLDRMDRPAVDRVEGVPPAIAIDQTNPVRTSRSTVGTMTELNDHLKLLFARTAHLHCQGCGRPVRSDDPRSIAADLRSRAEAAGDPRLAVTFPVKVPANFTDAEVVAHLEAQGYTRVHHREGDRLWVIQDRLRLSTAEPGRLGEAVETALRLGNGRVDVHLLDGGADPAEPWRYSAGLHCPDCDITYPRPSPSLFSFNSPLGACAECRGFGRVIGIDFGLVVPDEALTLGDGAVKPWQTQSFRECQDDLVKHARRAGVPLDQPWRDLDPSHREWVLEGDGGWKDWDSSWPRLWYGVRHFFEWLETKSYKMHIRVLLSRYRAYTPCEACGGARLQLPALLWRTGSREGADRVLDPGRRFLPRGAGWSRSVLETVPGLCLHDLMLLPLERLGVFFESLDAAASGLPGAEAEALELLLREIRSRVRYLCEVGLGYLTLDRQSRTLSGGEVQRINLTTALGTSLVNTLFVLDEPSIGLHPRDMGRVIAVMQRLRDAGNSLVVVEHDPQVMQAADRILDLGPGPGERGGQVVFFGAPAALTAAESSLTGDYLAGRRRPDAGLAALAVSADHPSLVLEGAREHNLRDVTVRFPLRRLVCVTGVSGSGKSTLVQDVLHPALLKALGRPGPAPAGFTALRGHESLRAVVMVDQSPIGKTTRSNPASYVGAFDLIRRVFAETPLARARGYTAGTFSFNAGNGRCPSCGGNGFEHVEMQFLSDVYLRCGECDGRRYRPEILEVAVEGRSLADVLDMTVTEAVQFFSGRAEIAARLHPLARVGLDYLRLGQPVPTLSGGEAQRLKLAGHLAESEHGALGPTLFLFDEPTSGLHFHDTARLLVAFRGLLGAGHSVIVIEHNLDVVRASDWVVDLGPEGGDGGGTLVAEGPPAHLRDDDRSHTGRALRQYEAEMARGFLGVRETRARYGADGVRPASRFIEVRNAREHNLRHVDVQIPHGRFSVITGVSGSGKSTLAFDILFAEGQRRYLESLNAYARQFVQPAGRPEVDAIHAIPPTVAIEQRTSRGGRKSTVGTLTEIHHYLRLLFMKMGTQHCPDDGTPIQPQSEESIVAQLMAEHRGRHVGVLAPLVSARKGLYTDLAQWARQKGHSHLRVDGAFLPTSPWPRLDRFREHDIALPVCDLVVSPETEPALRRALNSALVIGKGVVHVMGPLDGLLQGEARVTEQVFSVHRACPVCSRSFPEPDPRLFSFNSQHGWCRTCFGTGLRLAGFDASQTGEEGVWDESEQGEPEPCPSCSGRRLNPVALGVRFQGHSIADLTALSVGDLGAFLDRLALTGRDAEVARDLLPELRSRVTFMRDVGLEYLSLDRAAPTLSGGEAQRIRLAAQLGSNLQGVCYVLDEPSIGLHPRDNERLLATLRQLEAKGNTLVVVEHDEDTIRRADHVIDLGPGAGTRGGRVVATGDANSLERIPESVTGRFLAQPLRHPLRPRRDTGPGVPSLLVRGARLHNLQGVEARFPLAALTVVTGVSGSGKSTLTRDVLRDNVVRLLAGDEHLAGCAAVEGVDRVSRVLEVDQTPIGKTPRSCPATYVGFWDAIRRVFAETTEARMRGFGASRFSFNTGEGRCTACEGQGLRRLEMSFLPDVKVACDVCRGERFNDETLAVRYRGASIGDVLRMSVDDAAGFFQAHPAIHHALVLLQEVGLGYLSLGQQSPTLSGGEAQRIKLVTELARARTPGDGAGRRPPRGRSGGTTLYVLDEPTVGLHMADVERLIHVLHRLADAGNTVVLVEHNLDIMAEADWLVDMGPEGGSGGGHVVAQGAPEQVASAGSKSHTAEALAAFLRARGVRQKEGS